MAAEQSRRALVAPDSFKGTMGSAEVAAALAAGFETAGWQVVTCPLADGGEGTAEALRLGLGGRRVAVEASDPLGRRVEAGYTLLAGAEAAVVEVAEASGLWRLEASELDPLAATSRGTGELIAHAAQRASSVLVAVGGSATNDGGAGAVAAIADAGGLGQVKLTCLCDVTTPWERATRVFAPQKGASPAVVAELEARMEKLAVSLPRDPRGVEGGGAAGGLAGGLWACLGAELRGGASYVCDALGVDSHISAAALVVGGEGRLDNTTLEGKVLAVLARRCREADRPLHAVVGCDASDAAVRDELSLSSISEAGDVEALERAAAALAGQADRPARP